MSIRINAVAILIALIAGVEAQSCHGPGFRINGCDPSKPIMPDNRCGIAADGAPCPYGSCCGENGQCGTTPYHCGSDMTPAWGPARKDKRCGVIFQYAGCEPKHYCVQTYCVSEEFLADELNGTELAVEAIASAPVLPAIEEIVASCEQARDCPNPSLGVKEIPNNIMEITESVNDNHAYKVQNSAPAIFLLMPAIATLVVIILL